jgi:hypothetical protein
MLKSSSLCLYSSYLGTFWLKIEQFWPFEEISIFSNYEFWTFADFDRLCKLEKRGDEIKKNLLLWNYRAKKFVFLVMVAILDKEGTDGHNFLKGTT